ncbi:unnamed protein product [Symbiodinium sp. KB8]|nr:unnamed protein product [Symbiodinium sp. KB8]
MYALACAYYIYMNDLIDIRPADDLMEFIRRCCPIAYSHVGKVVSSYGGIRCPPGQALNFFPIWNKDRAYDEEGSLCFIVYHDAGNAAYAGFLKTLLSPQERIELFRGSENPLEELPGDVFELTLGMLTFALRWPELFVKWGDVNTINACINGLESCYTRYAAKESLLLISSGYPRKRKPAKADPNVEKEVQEILTVLPDGRFIAVPTSAELQPPSGVTSTEARSSDDNLFDTSQGVEVPRLIPDEVMEPRGQPEEENQVPEPQPNTNVADVVKAKTWDALKLLFNGEVWVDENTAGKMCILCGSPHHVFIDCKVDNPLRQQITEVFEHIKQVIATHPDTIVFQPGVFVVQYGYAKDLCKEVKRRRGDYNNVCGEDISETDNEKCSDDFNFSSTATTSIVAEVMANFVFNFSESDYGHLKLRLLTLMPWSRTDQRTPLVTLYVPIVDLTREGGRVAPYGEFEEIEKLLDYELEDEICTEVAEPLTPAANDMHCHRTLERILELLCELPDGPRDGTKAGITHQLSEYFGVDWSQTDWSQYNALYDDAVEFVILHSPPPLEARTSRDRNVRFRLCPWCFKNTPSCLARCTFCFSIFVSRGTYQRVAADADAPMEVPHEAIASAREAAANAIVIEDEPMEDEPQPEVDNDNDVAMGVDDARTIAEPEGELDLDMDIDEQAEGEATAEHIQEVHSRAPVLMFDTQFHIDPAQAHYQRGLMVNVYPNAEPANMTDPHCDYAKYMAYIIVLLLYKNWSSYSKWLELPVKSALEAFGRGQRHDSLGKWTGLTDIDARTGVPRELNDDEVLQYGIARGDQEDPHGDHALSRYRTNQILSILVRGAIQLGYRRQHFLVSNHIREGTEVDTAMVHSSCAALLSKIVGKVTGYQQFSTLSPRSRHAPRYILNIDPFGICQLFGPKDCTLQLIAMMVDLCIPIQRRYTTRLTQARAQGIVNIYQGNALQHLPGGSMLPPGQTSILNTPLTAEEAAEIAPKARPRPSNRAPDPQEHRRRNQPRYSENWDDQRWDHDRRNW